MSLCAVFCTADIPAHILDAFLQRGEQYLRKQYYCLRDEKIEDCVIVMTSADIAQVKPSVPPVEAFRSPFLGKTIEEVRDWFNSSITQQRDLEMPCMPHCFVVLDQRSVMEETCLFVSTQGGQLQSLRCDFDVAYDVAMQCAEKQSIEEGIIGRFMRSGLVMTRKSKKLALSGGLYIEGGEVKDDEHFRELLNRG